MRKQLNLVVAAATTLVVIAFLVPLAATVRTLARNQVLSDAERSAQTMARALGAVLDEAGAEGASLLVGSGIDSEQLTSIVLPDGTTLGAPAPVDEHVERARAGEAFRTEADGGEAVYVPVLRPGGGGALVVRVFVPESALTRNVASSWVVLAALGVSLIVLSIIVADRLARSLVEPVRKLEEAAHRLSSGDVDVRVEPEGPPELIEVSLAFNRLAGRIEALLADERESVADLSHRLRTPLTAVRLEVESLQDPADAERLGALIGDLEREVDRLIREARRPVRDGGGAVSDLATVVDQRVEFWGALAQDQGRTWELEVIGDRHLVTVNEVDLTAAIDALLGNVVAHTPEGTQFFVRVEHTDQGSRLIVEDEGPGFPSSDVAGRGMSEAGSTGLGLDIVRRTAESKGGSMTLETRNGGGARVVVEFGESPD